MDTLVSLGVAASFGWSLYALLFGGAGYGGMRMSVLADSRRRAGTPCTWMWRPVSPPRCWPGGTWRRARTTSPGSALTALAGLAAGTVAVLRDGAEQRVPWPSWPRGRFVVRPGERVATDGVVVEGRSAVDASLVTGESMPAEVGPGDEVIGSCVNMSGRLVVRATRVGADTLLAQITRLVSQAQGGKAAAQRLADRIAAVFVPVRDQRGRAPTLGFWLGAGLPGGRRLERGGRGAGGGLPVRAGTGHPDRAAGRGRPRRRARHPGQGRARAGDRPGGSGTVVLDKTGTLTTGVMTVQDIVTAPVRTRHPALARRACCCWPARWRTRPSIPWGRPSPAKPRARLGGLPPVTGFVASRGRG